MKVLVCGSRDFNDRETVFKILDDNLFSPITELVSGGARGVDTLAEEWARARGIKVTQFLPDWEKEPRRAGIIRNKEMVKYADSVIAIWKGMSRGTASTIDFARDAQKPLDVWHV